MLEAEWHEVDPTVVQALHPDLTDADARFVAAVLTDMGRLKAAFRRIIETPNCAVDIASDALAPRRPRRCELCGATGDVAQLRAGVRCSSCARKDMDRNRSVPPIGTPPVKP